MTSSFTDSFHSNISHNFYEGVNYSFDHISTILLQFELQSFGIISLCLSFLNLFLTVFDQFPLIFCNCCKYVVVDFSLLLF